MALRIAGFAGVLLALAFVSAGAGQEKTVAGKHDQVVLYHSLRDVINTGADLFNLEGDYAGCYRLYQGSLLSIKAFLHADMQRDIDTALVEAGKKASYAERAHHLRMAIDVVRARIKPAVAPPPQPRQPPPRQPLILPPQPKKPFGELIRVPPKKLASAPLSGELSAFETDIVCKRSILLSAAFDSPLNGLWQEAF